MEKQIDSKFSSLTDQELQMSKSQLYNYINSKKNENSNFNNKVSEVNNAIKNCNDLVKKLETASNNVATTKTELVKYYKVNSKTANTSELDNIISQVRSIINKINNNVIPVLNSKLNYLKRNVNTNSAHISLLDEYYNTLE